MQTVSNDFRTQIYGGNADYDCKLYIEQRLVPQSQIESIEMDRPIIDSTTQYFYIGTFIANALKIKFNNLDNLEILSGENVYLEIGLNINGVYEYVPIGYFIIDELSNDYYKTMEITCMDYSVLFKPNVDYSSCFVDGKTTIDKLLNWLCNHYNVQLGSSPSVNNDVEVSTYDSRISGKQWISYIAEIKGCNAKIGRDGKLYLKPIKSEPVLSISIENSKSWEVGEIYNITQVTYFDALRNYTFGDKIYPDDELYPSDILYPDQYKGSTEQLNTNTLFIRQDNPFINNENVVENIYNVTAGAKFYNYKCENIGDISLDAWDIVNYIDENGNNFPAFYQGKLNYSQSIMAENEVKIPTKQQEITTNIIGGDERQNAKIVRTTVDNMNKEVEILVEDMYSEDGKVNQTFTQVVQNIEGVVTSVQSSGGSNKIVNSVGFDGYNEWTPTFDEGVTETSPTIQSVELKEKTVSGSALVLNGYKISQEIFVKANMNYAFSCLVSKNNLNTSTGYIRIYDKNNPNKEWRYELQANRQYSYHRVEFGSENPVRITGTIIVLEFYGSAGSDMLITDSILNQGDYTSVWEQANGEILSSQVKVTKDGMKVQSSTSNSETVINSEEFAGYGDVHGTKTKVFTVNGNQTDVYSLNVRHDMSMPPLKVLSITGSSDNGWAIVGDE